MLELSTVIRELRAELTKAIESARDEPLRFGIGPIELEVTMVVTEETAGNGKVKFWVVETGADAKRSEGGTHRVKLVLTPEVKGRSPYVGGYADEDED